MNEFPKQKQLNECIERIDAVYLRVIELKKRPIYPGKEIEKEQARMGILEVEFRELMAEKEAHSKNMLILKARKCN